MISDPKAIKQLCVFYRTANKHCPTTFFAKVSPLDISSWIMYSRSMFPGNQVSYDDVDEMFRNLKKSLRV